MDKLKSNDNSGLAALAGAMPQHITMLDRKVKTLGQQVAMNKEAAISRAADAVFGQGAWDRALMRGAIYAGGREVYSHKGVDFVELDPVDFTNAEDDQSFVITAVQRWRVLEPKP